MACLRLNVRLRGLVFWFIGSIGILLPGLGPVYAQNLIANPGFESGTNGWFSPSNLSISSGAHSGDACAMITLPSGYATGIVQSIVPGPQAGQICTWSAWLRLSPTVPPPARGVHLNFHYTLSATNYSMIAAAPTLSTTWSQVSATFTLNAVGAVSNVLGRVFKIKNET